MDQIVYVSSAVGTVDSAAILRASRTNNRRCGVTGMLYFDGRRFLQVLEGEPADVARTFDRIAADPRHRALVVLSRRTVDAREFGGWAMAERAPDEAGEAFLARLDALIAGASASVRATFDGFARVRSAAA